MGKERLKKLLLTSNKENTKTVHDVICTKNNLREKFRAVTVNPVG